MSLINLFLQKRKMHESQYGFVMVFIAYALSVMMLFVGSDVFYNINSAAAGISTTDEETATKKKEDQPVPEPAKITARVLQSKELYPYAMAELSGMGLGRMGQEQQLTGDLYPEEFIPAMGSVSSIVALPKTDQNEIYSLSADLSGERNETAEDAGSAAVSETAAITETAEAAGKAGTSEKAETNEKAGKAGKEAKKDTAAKEAKSEYVYDITEKEIGMLQRIVQAEAGGEDAIGKILIVNVIMNRIADKNFPDTVEDVIFQNKDGEYQFSPIENKSYWSVKVSDKTKKAVVRALKGEDHSEGALYFMARKITSSRNSKWFDKNLVWLFKHGGHEFYKEK